MQSCMKVSLERKLRQRICHVTRNAPTTNINAVLWPVSIITELRRWAGTVSSAVQPQSRDSGVQLPPFFTKVER